MVDQSDRRVGSASAPMHHGEIIQGVFSDGGRLRRGLVTIPCTLYPTTATFFPGINPAITVAPEWKSKALRAAELTVRGLRDLGLSCAGGHLEVASDVPLCRGFGSSTSDVLATIWAVEDAYSATLPATAVAMLAVQAERASDSLMFEHRSVLFAHREGVLIEDFGAQLPAVSVLGFGTRPNAAGVDTLALLPARYTPWEIDTFDVLRPMLRDAVRARDVKLLGEVATASTTLNQRHLPIPELDRIKALALEVGALGIQTAHSGNVAGLLFDSDDPDTNGRLAQAGEMLQGLGVHEQWSFTTGG
ncbi:MAG: kinase [Cryptosporangiaceae bacterium]|jgi:uncharacterized protein involved in propanediol utilization|nr:kinase [Cryptosporangiaceae bacterium]